MSEKMFYAGTSILGLAVIGLILYELLVLTGSWLITEIIVLIGLLILALGAIIKMGARSADAPMFALIYFAASSINAIYLVSRFQTVVVYALIGLSIVGLFFVAIQADIYKIKNRVVLERVAAPKYEPKKKVASKKRTVKTFKKVIFYDVKSKTTFSTNKYSLKKRNGRSFFVAKVPRQRHNAWRAISTKQAEAFRNYKK